MLTRYFLNLDNRLLLVFAVILKAMKKFLLIAIFVCACAIANAQKVSFIYLQSENGSPFFVKMQDKVFSSSSAGYLILSDLKEGNYSFSVGAPGNKIPETKFIVAIVNNKDRGFLLKNFENGLSLFDLQTLEVIKSTAASNNGNSKQTITRTDSFTKLLSQAADDPSLLTVAIIETPQKETKKELPKTTVTNVVEIKPEVKTETKQEDKTEPVVSSTTISISKENQQEQKKLPDTVSVNVNVRQAVDTAAIKPEEKIIIEVKKPQTSEQSTEKKTEEVIIEKETEPYIKSVITKRSESSTTDGFGLVYLDNQYGKVDTIRLLIPNQKRNLSEIVEEKPVEAKAKSDQSEQPIPKPKDNVVTSTETENANAKKLLQKNTCKAFAAEKDFLRLRKNMASKTNDEAMIDEAKKYFRYGCFSTIQIKNLSVLFLTSSGKYQFFDAAHRHISDLDQFSTLQSEIKDEYYLKRFKALTGE